MEKYLKLRIYFYGNYAIDNILYINKTSDIIYSQDSRYKINPSILINKINKWEYFLFKNEINKESNDTIKNYLFEHIRSENIIKANEMIKDIISKHSGYENSEKWNEKISNILLEYRQF